MIISHEPLLTQTRGTPPCDASLGEEAQLDYCQNLTERLPRNNTCKLLAEELGSAEAGMARSCTAPSFPRSLCQLTCCQSILFANLFSCAMFLHIPKTAGSTIETILDKNLHIFGQQRTLPLALGRTLPPWDGSAWHLPPDVFERKFHRPFSSGRKVFCVVRDPAERFASEVNYRIKLHEGKSNFRQLFPRLTKSSTKAAADILSRGRFSFSTRREDILHLMPQVTQTFILILKSLQWCRLGMCGVIPGLSNAIASWLLNAWQACSECN